MSRQSDRAPLLPLHLSADAAAPLHRQLFDQIRDGILSGRLRPGRRLPSTRTLAAELGVSRNTILAAYDQLFAEGYTEGVTGSGTCVSRVLPEELLAAAKTSQLSGETEPPTGSPGLSATGKALVGRSPGIRVPNISSAFQTGLPEISRFPWAVWGRLASKFWRQPPRALLSYGEPGGYMPLRRAIADYLRAVRGLTCEADQIIITSGAQQALDLIARAMLDPGDKVWVEDPGYAGIHGVLTAAGATMMPVGVDNEGIRVDDGIRACPNARMAIVTPSHQYPLGAVMSLSRRLALLDWARGADAWILEDDYDSEYRYSGRPVSALQGLDPDGRVIYVGTFSKVLFPAIRLGYIVAPPRC